MATEMLNSLYKIAFYKIDTELLVFKKKCNQLFYTIIYSKLQLYIQATWKFFLCIF